MRDNLRWGGRIAPTLTLPRSTRGGDKREIEEVAEIEGHAEDGHAERFF
jgi:hypothetical protein